MAGFTTFSQPVCFKTEAHKNFDYAMALLDNPQLTFCSAQWQGGKQPGEVFRVIYRGVPCSLRSEGLHRATVGQCYSRLEKLMAEVDTELNELYPTIQDN